MKGSLNASEGMDLAIWKPPVQFTCASIVNCDGFCELRAVKNKNFAPGVQVVPACARRLPTGERTQEHPKEFGK